VPSRFLAVATLALGITGLVQATTAAPGATRQAELMHLLRHDCGSCHGMRLTGGLGPPLTPEALAGKPAAMLEYTIQAGRAGTPMPPWKGLLTDEETHWLVQVLLGAGAASE